MEPRFINFSKLDVVKRELEHSIRLFFNNGDVVVTHLTVSAARDILNVLGETSGVTSLKTEIDRRVKKNKQKFVWGKLREPYNFFKHSDSDPNKLLKFNPESTEFWIWDCVSMYQSLTSEVTGLMMAFRVWFFTKHPDLLVEEEYFKAFDNVRRKVDLGNKALFLDLAEEFENRRLIKAKEVVE